MPDRQKKLAHEFYDFAVQELSIGSSRIELKLLDRNWLWATYAAFEERSCTITSQIHFYQITFATDSTQIATGITSSTQETVSAVADWLDGSSLNEMYLKHEFVDRDKRFTDSFWNFAVENYPELGQKTTLRVDSDFSKYWCWLWISANDRSSKIYLGSNPEIPFCEFYWDECYLMRIQDKDYSLLSSAIYRWLCDYARPSELEQEFSLSDIDELARYYENGRGIEGEFIRSWDKIVEMYGGSLKTENTPEVLDMIAQMRECGYDKTLRAGQSLYTLVLSRSRRHGVRSGQPIIAFEFIDKSMNLNVCFDSREEFYFPKIEFTPQIDLLLKRLAEKNID